MQQLFHGSSCDKYIFDFLQLKERKGTIDLLLTILEDTVKDNYW